MADIIELGPHGRMTAEEALASTAKEPWEIVIICGFHEGSSDIVVRTSRVSKESALWIAEHLKWHILDQR